MSVCGKMSHCCVHGKGRGVSVCGSCLTAELRWGAALLTGAESEERGGLRWRRPWLSPGS